uniref:Uncharacterized protein n=1 Tax=Parascaris univalens TaxID=6257 RepID=A0A915BN47_PARUN
MRRNSGCDEREEMIVVYAIRSSASHPADMSKYQYTYAYEYWIITIVLVGILETNLTHRIQ